MQDKLIRREKALAEPFPLLLRKAENAFLEGNTEMAAFLLDRLRAQENFSAGEWGAFAHLNELLGRPQQALADYAKALKLEPRDAFLRLRRARILLELDRKAEAKLEVRAALLAGLDADKVKEFLGPLLRRPSPPPEPEQSELDRAFYDSRGRRKAIQRFLELFRGRPGAYARQWFDPKTGKAGYFPVLEPLTPEVVEAHLQGRMTVGVYLLDSDARVCFGALDLDLGKEAIAEIKGDQAAAQQMARAMRELMNAVAKASADLGLPVLFERSGYKGVHAWYFFEEPVPAWAAKEVLASIQERVSPPPKGIHLEVFPKQVTLSGKGYGNLIKLPLGVHRVTGNRSVFLDHRGIPVPESLDHLLAVRTVEAETLLSLAEKLAAGKKGRVVPLPERRLPKEEPAGMRTVGSQARPIDGRAKEAYARILEECALIRYLVRKAREFRHLSFDERKVILGVLGHLPGGAELVHHVISRCADYDPQITGHFISRMPSAPLGCRTIRRRLFYLENTRCACRFDLRGKDYPTPVLHASMALGESSDQPRHEPRSG